MMILETSRGQRALATSAIFTSLATFLVIIRVYARAFLVKQTGADDYTIVASLAFAWAFFGLFVGEVQHGMGEHLTKIPQDILTTQMICFWATIPIYQTSLITTKASILLQYKRIFSTQRMRVACWILIGFLAAYGTWTIISAWLNCMPVAKFWDDSLQGYCLNKKALWFSNSAIHIFTDVLILIYPMPALKALQLPKRKKIAVLAIFALGGFVLITSILRLHSLLVISNSTDPTYDNVGAATWSAVECNVAIICACLPSTRPIITKILPRFFSSHGGTGYRTVSKSKTPLGLSRSGNITGSRVQASVAAGHDPSYELEHFGADHPAKRGFGDMDRKEGDSASNSGSGSIEKGGIKVMTYVSQESRSYLPEETSSVKNLVHHL